ncbi:H-NS histone family protein [Pelomonas sp. P7]|uniref:H-NS histone family protein n=1 Tax=Pelomonas caseinilytica TaxID=2906763 RepID=A0ABS8XN47_9BURK|nr:H-NS histone family protein [Pelomonas sp. P7]MCE4540685.1 H-NS histone family protein [Pelomonas sp. P7]
MTAPDVSTLSYIELVALSKELDRQIAAKRGEELKVMADGFAKKVQAAGFTVREAIDELETYDTPEARTKKRPASTAAPMYRDPANPENTWSGRGLPAKWLKAYEIQGRSREEFRVNG